MPYLFTPPQRTQSCVMPGTHALVFKYPVSQTVWKDANGVWQARECPSQDELTGALKLLAVSGRPQIVDDSTAAELIAAGIGTCDQIDPLI